MPSILTSWFVDATARMSQFVEKLRQPWDAGFGDRSTDDVEREARELLYELLTAQRHAAAAWKAGRETETVASRAAIVVLASMNDRLSGTFSAVRHH
jgi:hypothetical protein